MLRIVTESQNITKLLSNNKGKWSTLTMEICANSNMIHFTHKNRVQICSS